MSELKELTAAELVDLHNERCRPEEAIEGPWKASKAELIDLIRTLGDCDETDMPETVTEADRPRSAATIGALVAELLIDPDLSYAEIVERVKEQFPNARTTARSVASVAVALRKKGVEIPKRGKRGRRGQ